MTTQLLSSILIKTTENTKLILLFLFFKKSNPFVYSQGISILVYSVDQCRVLVSFWAIQQEYFYIFFISTLLSIMLTMIQSFFLSYCQQYVDSSTVPYTTSDFLLYTPWIFENNFLFYYSFSFYRFGRVLLFYFRRLTTALAWRSQSHSHLHIFSYIHIFYLWSYLFLFMFFLWRPGRVLYKVPLLYTIYVHTQVLR